MPDSPFEPPTKQGSYIRTYIDDRGSVRRELTRVTRDSQNKVMYLGVDILFPGDSSFVTSHWTEVQDDAELTHALLHRWAEKEVASAHSKALKSNEWNCFRLQDFIPVHANADASKILHEKLFASGLFEVYRPGMDGFVRLTSKGLGFGEDKANETADGEE